MIKKWMQDNLLAYQAREFLLDARSRRKAESLMPSCPHCGGKLPGEFPKCQHCACDISWIDGEPCDPAEESSIKDAASRKKSAIAKRRDRLIEITIGTPNRCPKCQRCRPGMTSPDDDLDSTEYAMEWLKSMASNRLCPDCEPAAPARWVTASRLFGAIFLFLMACMVAVVLIGTQR